MQFGSKFISMAEPSSHCPCRPESGFVWEETKLRGSWGGWARGWGAQGVVLQGVGCEAAGKEKAFVPCCLVRPDPLVLRASQTNTAFQCSHGVGTWGCGGHMVLGALWLGSAQQLTPLI